MTVKGWLNRDPLGDYGSVAFEIFLNNEGVKPGIVKVYCIAMPVLVNNAILKGSSPDLTPLRYVTLGLDPVKNIHDSGLDPVM